MITISLCMIVKNEEANLSNCLDSIKDVIDEIIIVDTGSSDNTKSIAQNYTSNIYDFTWCNDFSKARNASFEYATKEYILWLDADDIISKSNVEKFKNLKVTLDTNIDYVSIIYSLNRNENNDTIYSLKRNRLVKRQNNFKWIGRVHEYLNVFGNQLSSDIEVWHTKSATKYPDRNLLIFRTMETEHYHFSTRDIFYFANELFYNKLFDEAIVQYNKFITSDDGWIEDKRLATLNLSQSYISLSDTNNALTSLFNYFIYDVPSADICCYIANIFFDNKKYSKAIYWYKIALECTFDENINVDCKYYYTIIPAIQLCVCYCLLEDYLSAYYYNELAAIYSLESEKVTNNKLYLTRKLLDLNLPIPKFSKSLKFNSLTNL